MSFNGATAAATTTTATTTPSTKFATGPKTGHWEGTVSFGEGDTIAFDVMPEAEVDNIELELTVNGTECTADVELAPIGSDGAFTLAPTATTNGIQGTFYGASAASGTVPSRLWWKSFPALEGTDFLVGVGSG